MKLDYRDCGKIGIMSWLVRYFHSIGGPCLVQAAPARIENYAFVPRNSWC